MKNSSSLPVEYTKRGWPVFPVGRDKEPLTDNGFYDATCDAEKAAAYWGENPDDGVAGRTGAVSGVIFIDVDPRNGGVESLLRLQEEYGEVFPNTLTSSTGGGGWHLPYKYPVVPPGTKFKKTLAPGIDIKADDGYVVLPPSLHESGQRYEWLNDAPVAELPAWLLERIIKKPYEAPSQKEAQPSSSPVTVDPDYVEAAVEDECRRVAEAKEGTRNETLNRASFVLGTLGEHLDLEVAKERLMEAARVCGLPDSESVPTIDRGLTAGAQNPRDMSKLELTAEQLDGLRRLSEMIIKRHAEDPPLIIQKENWYFVLADGEYRRRTKPELELATRDLGIKNDDGEPEKHLSVRLKHGVLANRVVCSYTLDESYYDPRDGTFYERVCPERYLEPCFDEQVAEWLKALPAYPADLDKLLDWLATVVVLNKPTSALYLTGPPGVGKEMLALGVAKLWSKRGIARLRDVLGANFNDALLRCPIVFSDEALHASSSAEVREFIGTTDHTLRCKHVATVDLHGCPRIILAANNDEGLAFREDLSDFDVQAIAKRFLQIPLSDRAAQYLEELGGRSATESWVDGDRIARHVLWLADNRTVKPGSRFLVEGDSERLARRIATRGAERGLVVEWLCNLLAATTLERHALEKKAGGLLRIGDGKYQIHSKVICTYWGKFIASEHHAPKSYKCSNILSALGREVRPRGGGTRPRLIELDVELLYGEADALGLDAEKMRKAVETALAEEPGDPDEPWNHEPRAAVGVSEA